MSNSEQPTPKIIELKQGECGMFTVELNIKCSRCGNHLRGTLDSNKHNEEHSIVVKPCKRCLSAQ